MYETFFRRFNSFGPVGLIGRCIKTDASQGSYVEIPDSRSLAAMAAGPSMSLLAWVYPMDEKNFSDIVTQGDWNVLQIRASNTELNYYSGSWRRGEVYTLLPDTWNRHWHHMAGVTDGVQQKLYIDGVLCSSKNIVTGNRRPGRAAIGSYHAPWNLGRNAEVTNRVFNGYLDEVMIYRIALSESQIQKVMMLSDR